MSSSSAISLDHLSPSEQLCYVRCNFCDTVLAVSVPFSSMFKTVTVRCGHCSNLVSVNMRFLLPTANPPSPVPEESEEGTSPRASVLNNGNQNSSLFDAVSKSFEEPKEKSSEAWATISKLTEEKNSAMLQSQKFRQELELMRKEISKRRSSSYSFLFVVLVGLLGILVGYLVKKT